MKTLIVIDRPLNPNTGGGAGYLSKLKSALAILGSDEFEVFSPSKLLAPSRLDIFIKNSAILLKFYKCLAAIRLIIKLDQPSRFQPSRALSSRLLKDDFRYVHVHHLLEAIAVRNFIVDNNIDTKIVYTPHDPGPTSFQYESYFASYSPLLASKVKDKMLTLEKEFFSLADAFVFPSQQALFYYTDEIKDLDEEKVYFVPTGTDPYVPLVSKDEFLLKRALSTNNTYFSFAGRHNSVKGYDIFKKAASISLKTNRSIGFLIAGSEGPMYSLEDPNWFEEGWTTDPASLVNASEVFVAPNRKGYFDLVILEAMSIGKVVIATKTGGAIDIAKYSKGVILVEPEDPKAMADAILSLSYMDKSELNSLGEENYRAYLDNFSIKSFGENYSKVFEGKL
ncbi:glycosyltransferase family 4 protein [Vibrio lentus]|uniref:glycosyltransferase family 4 protein n=1 Tax=Vibrio lentus TaxID=136468 RepID=UPI000C86191A|nr:glycosyltransferase family 4 protein [Vibrio lentus]PMG99008.1 hypothetical protein BCU78_20670 [Vibrio lentus]